MKQFFALTLLAGFSAAIKLQDPETGVPAAENQVNADMEACSGMEDCEKVAESDIEMLAKELDPYSVAEVIEMGHDDILAFAQSWVDGLSGDLEEVRRETEDVNAGDVVRFMGHLMEELEEDSIDEEIEEEVTCELGEGECDGDDESEKKDDDKQADSETQPAGAPENELAQYDVDSLNCIVKEQVIEAFAAIKMKELRWAIVKMVDSNAVLVATGQRNEGVTDLLAKLDDTPVFISYDFDGIRADGSELTKCIFIEYSPDSASIQARHALQKFKSGVKRQASVQEEMTIYDKDDLSDAEFAQQCGL